MFSLHLQSQRHSSSLLFCCEKVLISQVTPLAVFEGVTRRVRDHFPVFRDKLCLLVQENNQLPHSVPINYRGSLPFGHGGLVRFVQDFDRPSLASMGIAQRTQLAMVKRPVSHHLEPSTVFQGRELPLVIDASLSFVWTLINHRSIKTVDCF